MRSSVALKLFAAVLLVAAVLAAGSRVAAPAEKSSRLMPKSASQGCPASTADIQLPAGFCASVYADGIGHARQMAVAPNGVLYVNTWSGTYYGNDKTHEGGFIVALQSKATKEKADVVERFGETIASGGHGGTGIAVYKDSIYAEINDRIVRYALGEGSIVPKDAAVTVVSGLPLTGDHPMHPFMIASDGMMLVDVATATNSCQEKNRTLKSPGINPCKELETRGGIWRYDANKTDQKFSSADRYATGIRNGEGFATDASGRVFVTQHGRDQLHSNWPDLYQPEEEATLPAEQVMLLKDGGDYGWPECYFDNSVQKLVLAPEYGGDGKKTVGICAEKLAPAAAFPAHWAPNALLHYSGEKFPEHYRSGLFVAFHGSWNRAPYQQGGYNVVYQPMDGDRASGQCEIFADGFAGKVVSPGGATHRPSGLAVGTDGALFIADDVRGRIYRVTYVGGSANAGAKTTMCPNLDAGAGEVAAKAAKPPEGTNPDAGAAASVAPPKGATRDMVALGHKIYLGQVGGASCTGCHGMNGGGSTLGPPLTKAEWTWSDGSYAGIQNVINTGVVNPKKYRSPMPAKGGAQLTDDQVKALAAYVWTLSHQKK